MGLLGFPFGNLAELQWRAISVHLETAFYSQLASFKEVEGRKECNLFQAASVTFRYRAGEKKQLVGFVNNICC